MKTLAVCPRPAHVSLLTSEVGGAALWLRRLGQ